MGISGIINVNKPADRTSFSVVAALRKQFGEKRIGHAGTLDPIATGVLPVCLGQATKIIEYLLDSAKTYVALIELGITTDTFDRQGKIISKGDTAGISISRVTDVLHDFQGIIMQVPPAYSALKLDGKKYYELARSGMPLEPLPRQVKIESIEALSFDSPLLELRVRCSKGTYIRSLANDLGKKLSCGAYLRDLVRTDYGPFSLECALSMSQIEEAVRHGALDSILYPIDFPILQWPRVEPTDEQIQAIIHGHDIALADKNIRNATRCRAYNTQGKFLAVIESSPQSNMWHPAKVFL